MLIVIKIASNKLLSFKCINKPYLAVTAVTNEIHALRGFALEMSALSTHISFKLI